MLTPRGSPNAGGEVKRGGDGLHGLDGRKGRGGWRAGDFSRFPRRGGMRQPWGHPVGSLGA